MNFRKRSILSAPLLAAAGLLFAGASHADYDLTASFVDNSPTIKCVKQGRNCEPTTISVEFKNNGPDASKSTTVSLNQYNGRRASGYATRYGGSGSLERLNALQPGQTQTLNWTSRGLQAGSYTFQVKYSSPINDLDNNNHRVTRYVTVEYEGGSSTNTNRNPRNTRPSRNTRNPRNSSGSSSGYDVEATFPYNNSVACQIEINQIGQEQCISLQIDIQFKNIGNAPSPQRRVSLNKYNGNRATGYAQRFGGSGAFQTLPPLQPGQAVTLSWSSNAVPLGQYTFQPKYSGPLNDANNNNHAITETLNVTQ